MSDFNVVSDFDIRLDDREMADFDTFTANNRGIDNVHGFVSFAYNLTYLAGFDTSFIALRVSNTTRL